VKTAGAVYKKLKEVRFHHLIALYRKYLKRVPQNCKYNYAYVSYGNDGKESQIGLCFLHQENIPDNIPQDLTPRLSGLIPHLVDICQAMEDCRNCNAFVKRHDQRSIKELFEKELSIKKIRQAKYPDICALEWVLERSFQEMPPSFFQTLKDGIRRILKSKKQGV
jgi:hypothetical protein